MAKARREAVLPSLGIDGLPLAAGLMQPGGAYAIEAGLPWALVPLLAGMTARALLDGRGVTLAATPGIAADVLRKLAAHGIDTTAQTAIGRLSVLAQSEQPDIKLANFGAGRLVEELEYFCNPNGRLYVIAPADGFYATGDRHQASAQAELYARWCRDNRTTAVFIFTDAGAEGSAAAKLQALDGWYAGVARMGGDGLRLSWDVDHWRSPEGSVGSRQYGIGVTHDAALLVADGAQLSARDERIVEAPDYDLVLAAANAVRFEKSRPPGWQLFGSHEALLARASGAVAATFILDCGGDQTIDQLAHTVHHLRIHAGSGIKIIVRERGRRLRYNQEMLLLRLGANSVADSSLSFSRLLSLIDSLRDRSFDREVPPVFEDAVRAAMPQEERGYLAPPAFIKAVRESIARAAQVGVQCALLRLVINPQLPHLDVLRKIRAGRPGDIYSADERSVFLFLFACREPDIDTALFRILGPAHAEMYEAQTRLVEHDVIRIALDALERHLRITATADYSSLLTTPQAAPVLPRPAAAAAVHAPAIPHDHDLRSAPDAPPRSATRAPLPLRSAP